MKFHPASEIPEVPVDSYWEFIVLVKDRVTSREHTFVAVYCNQQEVYNEDYTITGWRTIENDDGGSYVSEFRHELVAWAHLPTPDEARGMMDGPW